MREHMSVSGKRLTFVSAMGSYHPAVHVRRRKSCAKPQIVQAIVQFHEGMQHQILDFIIFFVTHYYRYLETLESKLSEHERLQARLHELEARLRELDPMFDSVGRPSHKQHFLTPPESANPQAQSSTYVSPSIESSPSQSLSPHGRPYLEDCPSDMLTPNPVLRSLGCGVQGDQDTNTDPGVFESGDAGKGWYLGCASGSNSYSSSYS